MKIFSKIVKTRAGQQQQQQTVFYNLHIYIYIYIYIYVTVPVSVFLKSVLGSSRSRNTGSVTAGHIKSSGMKNEIPLQL